MEFIRAGRTRIFAAAKAILMAASAVALLAPAPAAAQNLVANGQFTNTTLASPGGYICKAGSSCVSQIASWSSTCESGGCGNGSTVASLLIPNSTNNGSAFNGGIGLATAPANPPGGGNIVAIDGDPTYTATISQVIAGLTVGTNYTLSFYQAAGEQSGFDTATTEHWSVTFGGGAAQSSTVMNNTPAGFVAWAQQNMTFTATAVSETLTFAALGTPPTGAPPVVLLSDVSLTAVPEPAGVAVLGFGLALLFVARRNRASGGDGTLAG